jgi:hypothetical protein
VPERRRGSAGRDRIDHRPGEHDDVANSVAGVANLLACADEEVPMVAAVVVMGGGGFDPNQPWLGVPYDVSASDSYFPPSFRRWDRMMEPLGKLCAYAHNFSRLGVAPR